MFHQLFTPEMLSDEEIHKHLIHLRRGYHGGFAIPNMSGEYDMIYEPYSYDHWAGSQEGFVNIFSYSGEERTDHFLAKYKPAHLSRNYWFMYLILLNQRFSAIRYLDKISQISEYTRREKEKLNEKILHLKTVFSFNVVSDDQLYQNIYSQMYHLLDIERLLADIRDNEEQVETLQNHELLENEKMTSRFLFGLSLLCIVGMIDLGIQWIAEYNAIQALPGHSGVDYLGLAVYPIFLVAHSLLGSVFFTDWFWSAFR